MSSLHIVYASTSGHTEYVVEQLVAFLKEKAPQVAVEAQRAEKAQAADLTRGDALVLASGTWNTGGVEGQLNPHMEALLLGRAKEVDLTDKPMVLIALGDSRYYYTARAAEHLQQFRVARKGKQLLPPLTVINEPYGQEERIRAWGTKLIEALKGS